MTREDPQLKIRLPIGLKARIEAAARSASRTLNAEVVLRLEQSFGAESNRDAIRALVNEAIDERVRQEYERGVTVTIGGEPMLLRRRDDGQGYEAEPVKPPTRKR